MSVNKAILLGNLGKDPELKHTASGKTVVNFSMATSERWTSDGEKQESTTWHNIVAWGKQAEVMAEYLRKGKQVYIEGRIANRSYDDKDGNKRYISEVVVQNFSFVGGKTDAEPARQNHPEGSEVPPGATPVGRDDQDSLPF